MAVDNKEMVDTLRNLPVAVDTKEMKQWAGRRVLIVAVDMKEMRLEGRKQWAGKRMLMVAR